MATVFELADVRSLILDILDRRNWFDSKQFDEIEEQFERAGPGTSPEVFLVKGGYISDQEIAKLYAEELFLPLVTTIPEGTAEQRTRHPAAREALRRQAHLPDGGSRRRS